MVGSTSNSVKASAAGIPRKPDSRSFQVARLALSHQINMSKEHKRGPNTATIQCLESPPSSSVGANLAASISALKRTAGQMRSARKGLPLESVAATTPASVSVN